MPPLRTNTSKVAFDPQRLTALSTEVFALIERHFSTLESKKVAPQVQPGDLGRSLSGDAPSAPRPFTDILGDIEDKILPGATQWQHPGFCAFYPANTTEPAVLADSIITALGAVGLKWNSCPIATELEVVVMDQLSRAMGIHGDFLHESLKGGGLIQNTASDAMAAVAVAARVNYHIKRLLRDGKPGAREFEDGSTPHDADSSKLVAYMSDDTNVSGIKAARVAGLRVHLVKTNILPHTRNYGITADQVHEAMEADRKKGLVPCLVLLTYGSTNTAGYDDVRCGTSNAGKRSFEDLRTQEDVWVHTDCAYAGAAFILEEKRGVVEDIQRCSTSFNLNGSKWLLCGFDSAFCWVRDRKLLTDSFAEEAEYLDHYQAKNADMFAPEFRDWSIPLGRKFRSLRVWMVLNYYGIDAIAEHVRAGIRQADRLRARMEAHPLFDLTVGNDLSLVCFAPQDAAGTNTTEAFMAHLNDLSDGSLMILPSLKCGVKFVRIALGGVHTSDEHVEEMWTMCAAAAEKAAAESGGSSEAAKGSVAAV